LSTSRPIATDESLVADFLANVPDAVGTIGRWAREVAVHRAWGFETADDVVQATLLAVVRGLRDGRFTGGDLRAWVRRIAKNLCVTSYRRRRVRGTEVPWDVADGTAPELASADPDPARTDLVRKILEGLDEACRRLLDLAYAQGLSRREIARELGISEGAARVRLHRCLERARAGLARTGRAT
jgi:RNA polymerase sigma-70 factor (ECF subfamily)